MFSALQDVCQNVCQRGRGFVLYLIAVQVGWPLCSSQLYNTSVYMISWLVNYHLSKQLEKFIYPSMHS